MVDWIKLTLIRNISLPIAKRGNYSNIVLCFTVNSLTLILEIQVNKRYPRYKSYGIVQLIMKIKYV